MVINIASSENPLYLQHWRICTFLNSREKAWYEHPSCRWCNNNASRWPSRYMSTRSPYYPKLTRTQRPNCHRHSTEGIYLKMFPSLFFFPQNHISHSETHAHKCRQHRGTYGWHRDRRRQQRRLDPGCCCSSFPKFSRWNLNQGGDPLLGWR